MPKKKAKSRKSDGKKTENKEPKRKESLPSAPDSTPLLERERDLYLIQLRHLEEKFERYKQKFTELEKQKKDWETQYSELEIDKKDIIEHLKRSLLNKENEADDLLERLESLQKAEDKEREELKLKNSQQEKELKERNEELEEINKNLESVLGEFRVQKWRLLSLEKQLATEREEHEYAIHELQMKAMLDRKRAEDKDNKMTMEALLQDLVEQRLSEVTKLALEENKEVKAKYSELTEQALAIGEENTTLRATNDQLRVDVDILEKLLSETSRESCVRKKVVEKLTAKSEQLQVELRDRSRELQKLRTAHKGAGAELQALRKEQASMSQQHQHNTEVVSRLGAQVHKEKMRSDRMDRIIEEAAHTLRQCMLEADAEDPGLSHWQQLMEELLVILKGHTLPEHDKPLTTPSGMDDQANDAQSCDSAAAIAESPAFNVKLQLASYWPGDLGLVPRPTMNQWRMFSRTGCRLAPQRKPASHNTSSSISLDPGPSESCSPSK